MKSLFNTLGKIIIFLIIFSSKNINGAQAPTYLLKVANESQPSPTTYEFEVFLLNTNSIPLELQTFQFGLGFDIAILNGGVPSFSIVNVVNGNPFSPAPSELNAAQKPTILPADKTVSTKASNSGGSNRYFNCVARIPPGAGSGSIISNIDGGCTHPGTRVARFRITNSVPFKENSTFKNIWSVSPGMNRINTIVQAYVGRVAANITTAASNINYNMEGSCIIQPDGLVINATSAVITTVDGRMDKSSEELNSLVAFPNPTNGKATITFNSDRQAKYSLKVEDMTGRGLINEIISAVKGSNTKEINLANVAKGLYLVSVQSEDNKAKTLRIVVE